MEFKLPTYLFPYIPTRIDGSARLQFGGERLTQTSSTRVLIFRVVAAIHVAGILGLIKIKKWFNVWNEIILKTDEKLAKNKQNVSKANVKYTPHRQAVADKYKVTK